MAYSKFLIVASKLDKAGINMTTQLSQFGDFKFYLVDKEAIYTESLDLEKIHENMLQYNLKEYKLTLEATHHGPLIHKPCVFVEIGSTENEWADKRVGFIVAKAISETLKNFKPNPYNEIAVAIGGPHYCPNFNKIQLRSNVAISHVIPQYAFPFTEEMITEAVHKTEEELDFVLLDWKGLGNAEQRQKIIEILNKLYINYKKTSDVGK